MRDNQWDHGDPPEVNLGAGGQAMSKNFIKHEGEWYVNWFIVLVWVVIWFAAGLLISWRPR